MKEMLMRMEMKEKATECVKNVLAGILIFTVLMLIGLLAMNDDHRWGDDFAAYVTDAIAIAEKRFDEQIKINALINPSRQSVIDEKELVYVWGYPLILSSIYRLVGFDLNDYSSIVYYKLPSLIFLALTGVILYLFYRRRFSYGVSVLLTMVFCCATPMLDTINVIHTDIPELFFCMASLLLMEVVSSTQKRKLKIVWSILLGISLWWAYAIRLNGITVFGIFILFQVLCFVSKECNENGAQRKQRHLRETGSLNKEYVGKIFTAIIPHLVFIVLLFLMNRVFKPATSNSEDVGRVTWSVFTSNIDYYLELMKTWMYSMFPLHRILNYVHAGWIFLIITIVGIVRHTKTRNIHLLFFLIGTIVVLCMLPYRQGLRYMFNILPILLMYVGFGCHDIWYAAQRLIQNCSTKKTRVILKKICAICVIGMTLIVSGKAVRNTANIIVKARNVQDNAYSENAIDIYQYIQENTADDVVIVFEKPRALYLNTGRMSWRARNGISQALEADYILIKENWTSKMEVNWEALKAEGIVDLQYSNDEFTLYRVEKPQMLSVE